MEPAGIEIGTEGDREVTRDPVEAQRGEKIGAFEIEGDGTGFAEGTDEDIWCGSVTSVATSIEEALDALEKGRLDLAREALEALQARLR